MRNFDIFIRDWDKALRVIAGVSFAHRQTPAAGKAENALSESGRRHSAGLMRVNHVGEVCAQALYDAHARYASNPEVQRQFAKAGREEEDHLAWTAQRLDELTTHASLLNPVWYAGAYAVGAIVAQLGDAHSLSFVAETERQVGAHLQGHLSSLPSDDAKSRAIVKQMLDDELAHRAAAKALGAPAAPMPVRQAMKAMAVLMTTAAYYV